MSTAEERTALINSIYQNALNDEPFDLAQAKTPDQVTAIQANLSNARHVYYSAIAAQLTQDSADVESAFKAASQALGAAQQARQQAAQIADMIGKLADATAAAQKLLQAAQRA